MHRVIVKASFWIIIEICIAFNWEYCYFGILLILFKNELQCGLHTTNSFIFVVGTTVYVCDLHSLSFANHWSDLVITQIKYSKTNHQDVELLNTDLSINTCYTAHPIVQIYKMNYYHPSRAVHIYKCMYTDEIFLFIRFSFISKWHQQEESFLLKYILILRF